jgi:hypothetical protein
LCLQFDHCWQEVNFWPVTPIPIPATLTVRVHSLYCNWGRSLLSMIPFDTTQFDMPVLQLVISISNTCDTRLSLRLISDAMMFPWVCLHAADVWYQTPWCFPGFVYMPRMSRDWNNQWRARSGRHFWRGFTPIKNSPNH